jgi:hypothetical protein
MQIDIQLDAPNLKTTTCKHRWFNYKVFGKGADAPNLKTTTCKHQRFNYNVFGKGAA